MLQTCRKPYGNVWYAGNRIGETAIDTATSLSMLERVFPNTDGNGPNV